MEKRVNNRRSKEQVVHFSFSSPDCLPSYALTRRCTTLGRNYFEYRGICSGFSWRAKTHILSILKYRNSRFFERPKVILISCRTIPRRLRRRKPLKPRNNLRNRKRRIRLSRLSKTTDHSDKACSVSTCDWNARWKTDYWNTCFKAFNRNSNRQTSWHSDSLKAR